MAREECILVVDDEEDTRELLRALLESEGYAVTTAADGEAALARVQETRPDLILLDIMMPEMNGYQVCERLKADPNTRDIPIIFISALEQTDDKVRAFAAGGVDYVTKPFQMKEVLARVATHLSLRALQQKLADQLQALQARNEELDTFARAVAHDLKAPLTSIIGFADMLEKLHSTFSDAELEESLRTISAKGREMDRIIDQLLFLSGVRKTEQVDIQPLNVEAIVNSALQRLADVIEEYQAEITLPDEWPQALGYRPWIEEIWVNYIRNAIEYGGKPPRIELGATVAVSDTAPRSSPDVVRFWVRDNNPRLAAERAPTQEHGLRMIIVQRIMEKLGRKADFESTDERGGVFSFTLRKVESTRNEGQDEPHSEMS